MERNYKIAVIGGGITGLSAAYYLGKNLRLQAQNFQIDLIEKSGRLGGVIETRRIEENDYLLEGGPDMFFTAKPYAMDLVSELGLQSSVINTNEANRKSLLVSNGKLVSLPEGFVMLAPSKLFAFAGSEILSLKGKLRTLMEPFVPPRLHGEDESVSQFVTRRFGREMLEKIAQPMVGGIYVGDVEKLSAGSTISQFVELEKTTGSVIYGLIRKETGRNGSSSGARYGMFLSFKGGMQDLVDTIQSHFVNTKVILNKMLVSLKRSSESWHLTLDDGSTSAYDAVVVSLPASRITKIDGIDEKLKKEFSMIPCASSAVINFVFDRSQSNYQFDGFGFVVPEAEGARLIAASFSSVKFSGRCPDAKVIVRAFLGGVKAESILESDDGELCRIALEELQNYLSINGDPQFTWLSRWREAMPQYLVGHAGRIDRIKTVVEGIPGFELAGNSFNGVGIPDCIQSGKLAAGAISDYLSQLSN